jgi:hypothetical protein
MKNRIFNQWDCHSRYQRGNFLAEQPSPKIIISKRAELDVLQNSQWAQALVFLSREDNRIFMGTGRINTEAGPDGFQFAISMGRLSKWWSPTKQ